MKRTLFFLLLLSFLLPDVIGAIDITSPSQPAGQLTPAPVQIVPVQPVAPPQPVPPPPPVTPPAEKIEPSPMERYVRGQMTTDISLNISQFGYDLFSQPPTTFAPVDAASVGPDYVIGPGDEIKITLWGMIEGNYLLVVDRDGNIVIPKVGVLTVVGMNLGQLKSFIQQEISKYYKDFNINITLGSLRGIRVFVVGNAMRPGSYVVSSLSTLVNALFASGGPSKTGSMRNVELKREGKTIVTFDMYDFILKGDKTRDVRLLPGDVIFIPPIGQIAAIAGSVKVPAIYELKGKTQVSELIGMAGGLLPIAFSGRVQVERIEENERHIVFENDLSKVLKDPLRDFILKDGDIVKVYPVGDIGEVSSYEINKEIFLSEFIQDKVRPWEIVRLTVERCIERRARTILGSERIPLERQREEKIEERREEIIERKEEIKEEEVEKCKTIFESDRIRPGRLELQYLQLRKGDVVRIIKLKEYKFVSVEGAVIKGGDYGLTEGMTIKDIVSLAGGLEPYANIENTELTRISITQAGPKTERVNINLKKAIEGDPHENLILKSMDFLLVKNIPEWELNKRVLIKGEVRFPGTYVIKKGERLADLIERAGGYTEKAYLRGAVFTRERVRLLQQKSFDEMVSRLEREIFRKAAAEAAVALSPEEATIKRLESEQREKLIQRLKTLKATGRMSVRLSHMRLLRGSEFDIELEEGDALEIPTMNSVVNVTGEVLSPGSFVYREDLDYKGYIQMAGDYSTYADTSNVYALKVDGTARKLSRGFLSWNPFKSRWEISAFGEEIKEIEPGDTIVVPEKLERIAWLREIKDITQILFQIAVTTGVVWQLF
ncbi:MAG: SLBB domain-containing protein [Nitrospirae bacterium]|nr:SLBB domain-containing protein [Nitrospirota bacterium]